MENIQLYANDINYGKIINFVIVDLFLLIISTVFVFNMK